MAYTTETRNRVTTAVSNLSNENLILITALLGWSLDNNRSDIVNDLTDSPLELDTILNNELLERNIPKSSVQSAYNTIPSLIQSQAKIDALTAQYRLDKIDYETTRDARLNRNAQIKKWSIIGLIVLVIAGVVYYYRKSIFKSNSVATV